MAKLELEENTEGINTKKNIEKQKKAEREKNRPK
jgi:hypothetical protein